MPTVGFLSSLTESDFGHLLMAFANQLASDLKSGKKYEYVGAGRDVPEKLGTNEVFICTRWAGGDYSQLGKLAGELVKVKPQPVVVAATGGIVSSKAAESKIKKIPIVFLTGRAKNQEHDDHGNNTQGIWLETTKYSVEFVDRHVKLQELLGFSDVSIYNLVHDQSIAYDDEGDWTNAVTVTKYKLRPAFDDIINVIRTRANALTISADSFFTTKKGEIVKFANNEFRKPVCYPFREYVEQGGLMSYGPNLAELYKLLGSWAAEIINKGLTAGHLAGLTPKTKGGVELVVNRATALSQLSQPKADEIMKAADYVI